MPGPSTFPNIEDFLLCDPLFSKTTQKLPNKAERAEGAEGAEVVESGTIMSTMFVNHISHGNVHQIIKWLKPPAALQLQGGAGRWCRGPHVFGPLVCSLGLPAPPAALLGGCWEVLARRVVGPTSSDLWCAPSA